MPPRRGNSPLISSTPTFLIALGLLFTVALVASNYYVRSGMSSNLLSFSSMPGNPTPVVSNTCKNTQQGKYFVTDDQGFVCLRTDVVDGCCTNVEPSQRYSCDYCNQHSQCCTEYEFCVSCCLHPQHQDIVLSLMLVPLDRIVTDNDFEFCQAKCRTSSQSVEFHKEYKSTHKFCYGVPQAKYPDVGHTSEMHQNEMKNPQRKKMIDQEHFYDTNSEMLIAVDSYVSNRAAILMSSNSGSSLQPFYATVLLFLGTLVWCLLVSW